MTLSLNVISKQYSPKAIAIYFTLLIVSAAIMAATSAFTTEPSSALYFLLMTAGAVGAIVALVKLVSGSRITVYAPTKSPIRKHSLYIRSDRFGDLIAAIENGDGKLLSKIACSPDSGLRLDIMLSADNKFVASQIFRYVPYSYEAASEVITLCEDKSQRFSPELRECISKHSA